MSAELGIVLAQQYPDLSQVLMQGRLAQIQKIVNRTLAASNIDLDGRRQIESDIARMHARGEELEVIAHAIKNRLGGNFEAAVGFMTLNDFRTTALYHMIHLTQFYVAHLPLDGEPRDPNPDMSKLICNSRAELKETLIRVGQFDATQADEAIQLFEEGTWATIENFFGQPQTFRLLEERPKPANDNLDNYGVLSIGKRGNIQRPIELSAFTFLTTCFPKTVEQCMAAAHEKGANPRAFMELIGISPVEFIKHMDAAEYKAFIAANVSNDPTTVDMMLGLYDLSCETMNYARHMDQVTRARRGGESALTSSNSGITALLTQIGACQRVVGEKVGEHTLQLAVRDFEAAVRRQAPRSDKQSDPVRA